MSFYKNFSFRTLTKEDINIYTCIYNNVSSIVHVGKCDINAAALDAIISWRNPDEFWILETSGNGFESVQDDRTNLRPKLPQNWQYIGLTRKRNYETALKTCRALGGALPMPDR